MSKANCMGHIYDDFREYLKTLEGPCYAPISTEEQIEILKKYKETGDNYYRDLLVDHNMHLVVSIAKTYLPIITEYCDGVDVSDLFQEGTLGLCRAIDKFDLKKAGALSTYATPWISQRIQRYIQNNASSVRIPAYLRDLIKRLPKTVTEFKAKYQREPTDAELAERLGVTEERLSWLLLVNSPTYLDNPIITETEGDHGDTLLSFGVFAYTEDDINEEIYQKERKETAIQLIREVCRERSQGMRDWKIMCLRFGLLDGQARTLSEVAEEIGCTRERVRQITETITRSCIRKRRTRGLDFS